MLQHALTVTWNAFTLCDSSFYLLGPLVAELDNATDEARYVGATAGKAFDRGSRLVSVSWAAVQECASYAAAIAAWHNWLVNLPSGAASASVTYEGTARTIADAVLIRPKFFVSQDRANWFQVQLTLKGGAAS